MEKNELQSLLKNLRLLQEELRNETIEKYKRVNPFNEDLTDWKEKGELLFGKGKNITVYDTCSVVGDVEVGENTWIGPYTALDGQGGLRIGKHCSISAGVNIVSHDSVKWSLSGGTSDYEYAPIQIGDCCYIGTGAMIRKGVSIGNHCLIGAGAVVVNNVPDNSIALGIPAKVKGRVLIKNGNVEFEYFQNDDKE